MLGKPGTGGEAETVCGVVGNKVVLERFSIESIQMAFAELGEAASSSTSCFVSRHHSVAVSPKVKSWCKRIDKDLEGRYNKLG